MQLEAHRAKFGLELGNGVRAVEAIKVDGLNATAPNVPLCAPRSAAVERDSIMSDSPLANLRQRSQGSAWCATPQEHRGAHSVPAQSATGSVRGTLIVAERRPEGLGPWVGGEAPPRCAAVAPAPFGPERCNDAVTGSL